MDMKWAKDGDSGDLYIVQARPETAQSRKAAWTLQRYTLKEKGQRVATGLSIGQAIAAGKACLIADAADIGRFEDGSVLVTEMTDPDWVPIMKKAAGIITDSGGRTCHAAIVSRELGVPAVVGTGNATETIFDRLDDHQVRSWIAELTRGYDNKSDYFVDHLASGIARIAAPHYLNPVVVRLSDFKTNEDADLIGGSGFEPKESTIPCSVSGVPRDITVIATRRDLSWNAALSARCVKPSDWTT